MKKAISLILAILLLASACAKKEEEAQPEETEPSGGKGTIQTSSPLDAKPPEIDFDAITDELLHQWDEAEPFDYEAPVVTSYVSLGQITGLSVTKESPKVTEEELQNEIDSLLSNYATASIITDRLVQEGDQVLADYAGYLDGTAFDGGTATDQTITAQGGTGYIEGFAEAFIGKTPGEEFSFDVTFPENYGYEELNGKEVTFVATVKGILTNEIVVPELDDEFVTTYFTNYTTAEEFRDAYRAALEKRKSYYVENQMLNDLWNQILKGSGVTTYPPAEVKRVYAEQRLMYEQYAEQYGVDYQTFLSDYLKATDEDIYSSALGYVKEDLIMGALTRRLNINPTDEEYAEETERLAEYNGMTSEELISYYSEEAVRHSVLWQLMMEAVAKTAVITEG